MRKSEIVTGAIYAVKVSGKVVPVLLWGESGYGGWVGMNLATTKAVRVRSAQRCRWRCADDGTVTKYQEVKE